MGTEGAADTGTEGAAEPGTEGATAPGARGVIKVASGSGMRGGGSGGRADPAPGSGVVLPLPGRFLFFLPT